MSEMAVAQNGCRTERSPFPSARSSLRRFHDDWVSDTIITHPTSPQHPPPLHPNPQPPHHLPAARPPTQNGRRPLSPLPRRQCGPGHPSPARPPKEGGLLSLGLPLFSVGAAVTPHEESHLAPGSPDGDASAVASSRTTPQMEALSVPVPRRKSRGGTSGWWVAL